MIEFRNDDAEYLRWVRSHPRGYVLNLRDVPDPHYVVLHRATCGFISGANRADGAYTSRGYRKVCSTDVSDLYERAKAEGRMDGSVSKRCGLCRP